MLPLETRWKPQQAPHAPHGVLAGPASPMSANAHACPSAGPAPSAGTFPPPFSFTDAANPRHMPVPMPMPMPLPMAVSTSLPASMSDSMPMPCRLMPSSVSSVPASMPAVPAIRHMSPNTTQPTHAHPPATAAQVPAPTLAAMLADTTGCKRKRSIPDFGGIPIECILDGEQKQIDSTTLRRLITPRRLVGVLPQPMVDPTHTDNTDSDMSEPTDDTAQDTESDSDDDDIVFVMGKE